MCEAEKIYANDKVSACRITEENEKRLSEAGKIGANIVATHSETSRLLDAPEKKYKEDHGQMAHVPSFGDYGKEAWKMQPRKLLYIGNGQLCIQWIM